MIVNEDGIVICNNEEHPINVYFLIRFNEHGSSNVICDNDEHLPKAKFLF